MGLAGTCVYYNLYSKEDRTHRSACLAGSFNTEEAEELRRPLGQFTREHP